MPKTVKSIPLIILVCFIFCHTTVFSQQIKVDSIQKILSQKLPDTARLRLLTKLTTAYSAVDPQKMQHYALTYKRLAEKLKNDTLIAHAYFDIGVSYGIRSQMDSAMYYSSQGYNQSKKSNYVSGIARGLANMGFIYDRLDKKKDALNNYLAALPLYKKLGQKKGMGQCNMNIGSLYYDLLEYETAEGYFEIALKNYTEAKHQKGIGAALYSLGSTAKERKEYKKSSDYFTRSLALREKLGDFNGIALTRMGIAKLDIILGKYDDALANLAISLKLMRQLKDPYQECAIMIPIADAYLGKKDYASAEMYGQKALALAKSLNSRTATSTVLETLIDIYKTEDKIRDAFKYQNDYIDLQDSIQSDKTANELMQKDFSRVRSENNNLVKDNNIIATKNTGYLKTIIATSVLLCLFVILLIFAYRTNNSRKRTNKLLLAQKEEIASINEELETLNEEINAQMLLTSEQNKELEKLNRVKNKFFSIVSHDLRSPLATLKMLFSLYREGNLNETELKEVMQRLEDATYSTSAFLDNLLEWSRSQLDGIVVKPSVFDISEIIAENTSLIEAPVRIKNLVLKNHIHQPVTAFADPNMINVVVRNLLSNSVKFCNPGDEITIDVQSETSKVILSIGDTGPGISEQDLEKLFLLEHTNSIGTSGEKGYHIGLILCKDMVEQNNGKIWVESKLGKGTVFYVELPANEA